LEAAAGAGVVEELEESEEDLLSDDFDDPLEDDPLEDAVDEGDDVRLSVR
jgi:hypothetical protein